MQAQVNNKKIDLSYLFGYYNQDGNHSAVTGGEGTEKLSDYDSRIIVHIPLDSTQSLGVKAGVNYYTSASSDKIDSRISSASKDDVRTSIEMNYSKRNIQKNSTISLQGGGSVETDYISASFGGGWSKSINNENTFYGFNLIAYFDTWNIILPEELRTTGYSDIKTDKRKTFDISFFWTQIMSKRSQININFDPVFQQGLLSTPFHRVYFENFSNPKIEKLPNFRAKFPLSLKWNHRLHEHLVLKTRSRLYIDNWGIIAISLQLENPILIKNGWSISPFYRFHIQKAAEYFAPKSIHQINDIYYTSDYDLSGLNSHRYGVSIRYFMPLKVIVQGEEKKINIAGFEIRSMRYVRSDGLKAWLGAVSLALKL